MKVYVSATYADLIEYRAAVARVLRQMGHKVIGMLIGMGSGRLSASQVLD